jgi:hypothetical protein
VLDSGHMAMTLDLLSDADKTLVGQALHAAVEGPFFPQWEFHALFGLTPDEVRTVAHAWPNLDVTRPNVSLAVNNSLANLLGYPHGKDSVWSKWISVDRPRLRELFDRVQAVI